MLIRTPTERALIWIRRSHRRAESRRRISTEILGKRARLRAGKPIILALIDAGLRRNLPLWRNFFDTLAPISPWSRAC
jgi:hypothetical protein